MTHPILRSFLVALSCSLLAGAASATPIDFETIPGGVPSEGLVISDQFRATHGVRFSLEGGGFPVLAQVGSPMTAFGGPPDNAPDTPAPEAAALVGQFFLTDDGFVSAPPLPLLIHYDTPVSAASGLLIDVDGYGAGAIFEAFLIEARGADDGILETMEIIGSIELDGQVSWWSFERELEEIFSIRISYTGNKPTGIGLAFDQFSPSTPFRPPVPEPGTIVLTGLGLAGLAARRRAA